MTTAGTTTEMQDGDEPALTALVLPLGDESIAVLIGAVREVVTGAVPTPLPTAPPSVLGLFNLRGEVMPLFDPAVLLGFGPRSYAAPYAVVLDSVHGRGALAVQAPPRLTELGEPVSQADHPATLGAYPTGDDTVAVLLDVDALLAPARIAS